GRHQSAASGGHAQAASQEYAFDRNPAGSPPRLEPAGPWALATARSSHRFFTPALARSRAGASHDARAWFMLGHGRNAAEAGRRLQLHATWPNVSILSTSAEQRR